MKKKLIAIFLVSTLLFGCGSTKPLSDDCCEAQTRTEVISNTKTADGDPLMKLLLSGLIIYSVQILFAR